MTDFIRELYYGNLRPMSEGEIPDDLAELVTHAVDLEDRLTVALKGEEKDLFLDYVDTCNEAQALSDEENFISGFRYGARFMTDVFDGDENYLREDD
ncbi:MAG: hypothetical protein IIY43_06685 [Oscillospiraceae bacterium]|nr:hypothetical protein [Oscillospiraceae bacterium]